MLSCPNCISDEIYCLPLKSRFDSWRETITGKRPHRCKACGWRGWGVDTGPKFSADEIEIAYRAVQTPFDPTHALAVIDEAHRSDTRQITTNDVMETADTYSATASVDAAREAADTERLLAEPVAKPKKRRSTGVPPRKRRKGKGRVAAVEKTVG